MSRKRARKFDDSNVVALERALYNNGRAMEEGPKRKRWTMHDLKTITALTPNQEEMIHDFISGKHICAHGSAGTGKTFVALYLALNELLRSDTDTNRIVIVRSAVQTRDLGFMPGTLEEKTALYELPYDLIVGDLIGRSATYDDMKKAGLIEFCTTSFVRGLTWDNAIVIVDEVQNMNFHEINSVMTRLGEGSRIILVGDLVQTDLRRSKHDTTGIEQLIKIAGRMPQFTVIGFTQHDIVRSEFVKSWIVACEEA